LGKYFHGFCGGLPTTRKGHGYVFVVVDRFRKMCMFMPCKNNINRQEKEKNLF
jgi:hypothetical protein